MDRKIFTAAVVAAAMSLPAAAWSTNGYFSHGYGTEYKGMAGAGSALAIGALAGATNPAAVAFVGKRNQVALAFFNPNREYTVTGSPSGAPGTFGLAPGTVTSSSNVFVIPNFAMSRPFGDRMVGAIAAYANGGMNTNYQSPTFGSTPTGVDLEQFFVAPTWSWRFATHHAFGASAVLGYQRFSAQGLGALQPFSSDPTALTDRGHANAGGGGARIGYMGEVTPWLSAGASYQSRIWMSKFGSYAGLFTDAGDFDVPSTWNAGIALKPHPRLDLVADLQRVNYSEVHSIGHPMLPNLIQVPLGLEGGAGFGWRDITTIKLGTQVRTGKAWTWRAGYSFGDQPIPSSEVLFNILAPGVIERSATLGFTRELAGNRSISAALMRAFSNVVSGPNPLEVPGQQHVDLRMDEWEFEVGYAWSIQ
jgi:long-chain fatty acid transport protein